MSQSLLADRRSTSLTSKDLSAPYTQGPTRRSLGLFIDRGSAPFSSERLDHRVARVRQVPARLARVPRPSGELLEIRRYDAGVWILAGQGVRVHLHGLGFEGDV